MIVSPFKFDIKVKTVISLFVTNLNIMPVRHLAQWCSPPPLISIPKRHEFDLLFIQN